MPWIVKCHIAIAVVLLSTAAVIATPRSARGGPKVPRQTGTLLSLHIEVARQSYCHVDNQVFTVFMDLKMRFTNISKRPVILSRTIENPPIIHVASSIEAAQKKDFLYDPNFDYFPSDLPDGPGFGAAPDETLFVVLPVGGNYETVAQSGVIGESDVALEGARRPGAG
jgi:hypothetical protein